MRIVVLGTGGVGGYFGGKLAQFYADNNDIDVIFVARGEHLEKIRTNGLTLITNEETITVRPSHATDNPCEFGTADLVLFCTKAYDIEDSAALLKDCVNKATIGISLLNGVDNAQRIRTLLPDADILDGGVYISAYISRPGAVTVASETRVLFFGADGDTTGDYGHIERIFTDAGINAAFKDPISPSVWEKYLFVAPLASATTYLDKTVGDVLDDQECRRLFNGLFNEVLLVCRAQGIAIRDDIRDATMRKLSRMGGNITTSLHKDFKSGRKTELETLTGYVIRAAKSCNIAVPHHEQVYAFLSERISNKE